MTPHWTEAADHAERIAASWTGAPGGAFVLFDRDGVRAVSSNGLATIEHGIPFTADTPSRYASISKHFLAAALLLEGVDLERELGGLLPDLPAAIGAVPLARALDMTGGLPDMMEVLWQQGAPFTASLSAGDVRSALNRLDVLCAPPGTEMAYSNTGWRLGQAVLERHTGRSYGDVLRDRMLAPLGVPITFPYDETEPVPGLATGYWLQDGAWRRGRYGMHISASGGLAGSGTALARWAGALMAGRGPLADMLGRLLAPRHFADGTPSAYRLGLVETRLGRTRIAAHSGSLPGYRNHLLLAPDLGVGVVLLLNRDEDPLPPALRVMATLIGETTPEAASLPPGLYAAEDGPDWAELHPDAIEFMGGRETLLADGDRFRSIPSTLEVSVRIDANAIEGTIGGVRRRLMRVPAGLTLDRRLAGSWRDTMFGSELLIRADGTARWPFAGGLGQEVALTPLPGPRALAAIPHLMWRHRPCLYLEGDTLRVASHRARVLRFVRA
ncbi:MAG TPA: serine hydrolase domain-containing protein [Acetobacteraceae bacterium]|nr:serine hydrolase domain-containing protein [Acetobacteraceae bacterium]